MALVKRDDLVPAATKKASAQKAAAANKTKTRTVNRTSSAAKARTGNAKKTYSSATYRKRDPNDYKLSDEYLSIMAKNEGIKMSSEDVKTFKAKSEEYFREAQEAMQDISGYYSTASYGKDQSGSVAVLDRLKSLQDKSSKLRQFIAYAKNDDQWGKASDWDSLLNTLGDQDAKITESIQQVENVRNHLQKFDSYEDWKKQWDAYTEAQKRENAREQRYAQLAGVDIDETEKRLEALKNAKKAMLTVPNAAHYTYEDLLYIKTHDGGLSQTEARREIEAEERATGRKYRHANSNAYSPVNPMLAGTGMDSFEQVDREITNLETLLKDVRTAQAEITAQNWEKRVKNSSIYVDSMRDTSSAYSGNPNIDHQARAKEMELWDNAQHLIAGGRSYFDNLIASGAEKSRTGSGNEILPGISDEQNAAYMNEQYLSPSGKQFLYMTEEERNTAAFLSSAERGGRIDAGSFAEYMGAIADRINKRIAQAEYGNFADMFVDEDGNGRFPGAKFAKYMAENAASVVLATESYFDNLGQAFSGVLGGDPSSAGTVQEYKQALIANDMAQTGPSVPAWLGGRTNEDGTPADTWAGWINSGLYSLGNMVPAIAGSAVANFLVPGSGAFLNAAMIGTGAAGAKYKEMLQQGYTVNQARAVGVISGISEAATEKLLNGLSYAGTKSEVAELISGKFKNLTAGIERAGVKAALNGFGDLLGGTVSEVIEEELQNYIDSLAQWAATGDWDDVNGSDIAETAVSTIVTTLLLEGAGAVSNFRGQLRDMKEMRAFVKDAIEKHDVQSIYDAAKQVEEDRVVQKLADQYAKDFSSDAYSNETEGRKATEALYAYLASDKKARKRTENNLTNLYAATDAAITSQEEKASAYQAAVARADRAQAIDQIRKAQRDEIKQHSDAQFKAVYGVDRDSVQKQVDTSAQNSIDRGTGVLSESKLADYRRAIARYSERVEAGYTPTARETETVSRMRAAVERTELANERKKAVRSGKIARIGEENGKKVFITDAGERIQPSEARFSGEAEAAMYLGLASSDISVSTANALISTAAMDSNAGDLGTSFRRVMTAYRYGRLGDNQSRVRGLSNEQYQFAYNLGRQDAASAVASAQNSIDRGTGVLSESKLADYRRAIARYSERVEAGYTPTARETETVNRMRAAVERTELANERKEAVRNGKISFVDTKKRVRFIGNAKAETARQNVSIKVMGAVASAITHSNVYIYSSVEDENGKRVFAADIPGFRKYKAGAEAPNGFYDPKTGDIYLDVNAGDKGQGAILYAAAHELAHFVAQWSPERFETLATFLAETYGKMLADGKTGYNMSDLIRNQMRADKSLTWADAREEVVADAMSLMFRDGDLLQRVIELSATTQGRSIANSLRQFLLRIAAKIAKTYAGLKPDAQEALLLEGMKDEIDRLAEIFSQGIVAAGTNFERYNLSFDAESASVAPRNDLRSWNESAYVKNKKASAEMLAKALGVSEESAEKYIDDINSIARMIADDRERLDYTPAEGLSSFVSNVEYGGSFDLSTLCAKRRYITGTISAIQEQIGEGVLSPLDILKIRNMMKQRKYIVNCGLCYVEGSRSNMGKFAKEFIARYQKHNPDAKWIPKMNDVFTPIGIENMRTQHPDVYAQYEKFWNNHGKIGEGDSNLFASQQKPKQYQMRTNYKGNEITDRFKDEDDVNLKNENGGIRIQSFSDFELVHALDMMQVIMDMSRVGLAGQAYTKVPEFAWMFGNTGLKINLSLIAKGVDKDGNLIFDDVEGMKHEEAFDIRSRFSKNVGTILVTFDDKQLYAAMKDPRIDFIIPFHRSQWKKSQYADLGLPSTTKDYTYVQNEKYTIPKYHEWRGNQVKEKAKNFMPNAYWKEKLSGKENAEEYLRMCHKDGRRPKFYKLLDYNADGSYSLKKDGSTDGYWKLLIDFKMYDNDGNYAPQQPVRPVFNMGDTGDSVMDSHSIQALLNDYKGGHDTFPVAEDVVQDFVAEYKQPKVKESARIKDQNEIDRLESEPKLKLYRSMIVIDGKLYSPMATYVDGKLQDPYEIGQWYRSIERPDLAYPKLDKSGKQALYKSGRPAYYFDLQKGGTEEGKKLGGKMPISYNPYEHFSNSMLNDQFESAYKRPNLVVVEFEVPKSEEQGQYLAKYAKDPVGWVEDWHAGGASSASKNAGGTQRKVFLSRWAKPIRIVPVEEVADAYAAELNATGTPIKDNVVSPELLPKLEERGVQITRTGKVQYSDTKTDIRYSRRNKTEDLYGQRVRLAEALATTAETPEENKLLNRYVYSLDNIRTQEERLMELETQIDAMGNVKKLSKEQKTERRRLLEQANQAKNRITIYDSQLTKMEDMKPLRAAIDQVVAEARRAEREAGNRRSAQRAETAKRNERERQLERQKKEAIRDTMRLVREEEKQEARHERELARERRRTEQAEAKTEALQEARKRDVEKRKATRTRNKIKDLRNELAKRVRKGRNNRSVAEELIDSVITILEMIDVTGEVEYRQLVTDDKGKSSWKRMDANAVAAFTDEEIQEGIANGTLRRIKAKENREAERKALEDLRDLYHRLRKSDEDNGNETDKMFGNPNRHNYATGWSADIEDALNNLVSEMRGMPLWALNGQQLENVYNILKIVTTTINDANKQIEGDRRIDNYRQAEKLIDQQNRIAERRNGRNALGKTVGKVNDVFRNLFTNALRAVHEMADFDENSPLYRHIEAINTGLRRQNMFQMEETNKLDALRTDKDFRKWYADAVQKPVGSLVLEDVHGGTFNISLMQVMQFLLTYEREQANENHNHLAGNVYFPDVELMRKGKYDEANSAENRHELAAPDENVISAMYAAVGGDENALKYMNTARIVFNDCATAINEVTRVMYGVPVARDKAYIPYVVAEDYTVMNTDNVQFDATLEGAGMLKELVPGSKAPLVMAGLHNVLDGHVKQTARVYGLMLPVRNINTLLNTRMAAKQGGQTVKGALLGAWGKSGVELLSKAIGDVQAARKNTDAAALLRFLGKIKNLMVRSTLGGSISVATKQVASYFSSGAYLDRRALAAGMAYFKHYFSGKHEQQIYDEIDAHTAAHWLRRQGMSLPELADANQGGALTRMKEDHPVLNKASPYNWIQNNDMATTAALWVAVKNQIGRESKAAGVEVGSTEYWTRVTDLYDRVIENTQPMYDPLHRAEIAKSRVLNNVIMFKTQPLQNAGMMRESSLKMRAYKRMYGKDSAKYKAAVKEFRGATRGVVVSSIVFTALTVIAQAINHRLDDYLDDETGEMTARSFLDKFSYDSLKNIVSNTVPVLGELAWGAAELIAGKSTYDPVSDFTVDQVNTAVRKFSKLKKDPSWDNVIDMCATIANAFGVPAGNILRLVNGVKGYVQDFTESDSFEEAIGLSVGGNKTAAQKRQTVYQALLSGDQGRIDAAMAMYDSSTAYYSAVKSALRENDPRIREAAIARKNNDLDAYERLCKEVQQSGAFTLGIVKEAADAERKYYVDKIKAIAENRRSGNDEEAENARKALVNKGYDRQMIDEDVNAAETEHVNDDSDAEWWEYDDSTEAEATHYSESDIEDVLLSRDEAIIKRMALDIRDAKEEANSDDPDKETISAIRSGIRRLLKKGKVSENEALSMLLRWTGAEETDGAWQIEAWMDPSGKNSKYWRLFDAAENGEDIADIWGKYSALGVDAKNVATSIYSRYRDRYKSLPEDDRAIVKEYILDLLDQIGYRDRIDNAATIDGWLG